MFHAMIRLADGRSETRSPNFTRKKNSKISEINKVNSGRSSVRTPDSIRLARWQWPTDPSTFSFTMVAEAMGIPRITGAIKNEPRRAGEKYLEHPEMASAADRDAVI
jgi:hypothetical protein